MKIKAIKKQNGKNKNTNSNQFDPSKAYVAGIYMGRSERIVALMDKCRDIKLGKSHLQLAK